MKDNKTTAETLVDALMDEGVKELIGYPGGEVVDVIEAAENRGMPFYLTGHEASAAFMAAAIGRLTGRPGACISTLGPGACNLALGIGNAYLDKDPMIAIAARTAASRERISSKQNLPLNKMMEPVCKWSVALDGQGTRATVAAACEVSTRPAQGPVFMTLPGDTAVEQEQAGKPGQTPPASDPILKNNLEDIADILARAKRPIAVIGLALDQKADRESIDNFLQMSELPYVVMPQGKGAVSESADNFLGVVGGVMGDGELTPLLNGSDCLLGIGLDSVENCQEWLFNAPFYSIANAAVGHMDFQPIKECIGQVGSTLDDLSQGLTLSMDWKPALISETRNRLLRAIRPGSSETANGLSPLHVLEALREALPEKAIVATDVGSNKSMMSQAWETKSPGSFLVSNGLGSMGFGLPSANAAALINPETPVVAVVGDGGFSMCVHELETARRLGLAPLIVVLYDGALSMIKVAQDIRDIPYRGVSFSPVDWARVADGFGAHAIEVKRLEEIQKAVQTWRTSNELTVIVVTIDDALYTGLTY